jgi:hypothetical protein
MSKKIQSVVRLGFCLWALSAQYLTINRSDSSIRLKFDNLSYSHLNIHFGDYVIIRLSILPCNLFKRLVFVLIF